MPLVHRHIAKESKEPTNTPLSDDNKQGSQRSAFRKVRTYAQTASIPALSIHVPEPIMMHNSYSTLNDIITSSSNDSDKYTWKSDESSDSLESNTDNDMSVLNDANDANDASDELSDTDYSDMPPLIDESCESQSSESTDSDQEIIVNHTRYQRVRKPCSDNLPCAITVSFTLWTIAMFMQLIFQLCGLVNNKCSRRL
jgi:hypothetical protein